MVSLAWSGRTWQILTYIKLRDGSMCESNAIPCLSSAELARIEQTYCQQQPLALHRLDKSCVIMSAEKVFCFVTEERRMDVEGVTEDI